MNTPKRPILVFLLTNAVALSLVFALVTSCKKSDDPVTSGPNNLTTIAGNWKLTTLNVNPAVTASGLTVNEVLLPLSSFLEPGCANNVVISFNNGSITNNFTAVPACNNAPTSRSLVEAFFSGTTSYTETATQVTFRSGTQAPIVATKAFSTSTATLTTQLPVNPLNQPTPTSYTIVMAKQN